MDSFDGKAPATTWNGSIAGMASGDLFGGRTLVATEPVHRDDLDLVPIHLILGAQLSRVRHGWASRHRSHVHDHLDEPVLARAADTRPAAVLLNAGLLRVRTPSWRLAPT